MGWLLSARCGGWFHRQENAPGCARDKAAPFGRRRGTDEAYWTNEIRLFAGVRADRALPLCVEREGKQGRRRADGWVRQQRGRARSSRWPKAGNGHGIEKGKPGGI